MDLWIGDRVRVISKGITGTYEGIDKGKAKIKSENEFLLVNPDDLAVIEEEEELPIDLGLHEDKDDQKAPLKIGNFSGLIDLHIEVLAPWMQNSKPEMILNHQLKMTRNYLNDALRHRQYGVTIIHGKGLGALKMEIEHLLKAMKEVRAFYPINDGGGIEVFFKY